MAHCSPWRIKQHPWPCPSHNLPHPLAHFFSVTVHQTILASRLTLTKRATLQTLAGVISQRLVFCRRLLLVQMMTAIDGYHQTNSLLVKLYPAHFLINVEPVVDALPPFTCTAYTPLGRLAVFTAYDNDADGENRSLCTNAPATE